MAVSNFISETLLASTPSREAQVFILLGRQLLIQGDAFKVKSQCVQSSTQARVQTVPRRHPRFTKMFYMFSGQMNTLMDWAFKLLDLPSCYTLKLQAGSASI